MKHTKKLIAVILCLALTAAIPLASVTNATYSPEKGEFVFSGEDMLSYIKEPNGVDVTYDENANAMKMVVNNNYDPRALLDMSSLGLSASDFRSLLVIYRVPTSASSLANMTELFISAGSVTVPTGGKSVRYSITKSSSYTSQIVDLSALSWWSGDVHSIRIDPFTSSNIGDTMYIDSVILCSDYNSAISVRDARIAEIYGVSTPDYSGTEYICTKYEYDKYTSPLWKGDIVYNEAVYPIKDSSGNAVYTLMYTPNEITSVYSSDFTSKYYEGIDYVVNGNEITFLESGSINLLDYTYIHPQSNPNGYNWDTYYNRTAAGDGKWEFWGQSDIFFNGYINVSYTHSDTWGDYIPPQKSDEIPITASKIENKNALNVVFYGDSICGGANSSSYRKVYPYAEYWNEMIVSKLRNDLGLRVHATYSSVGGSTATDMVEFVDSEVTSKAPDLVFIEFGANDAMNESQSSSGSASRLKSNYKSAIIEMIEEVRDTYPNCEFVLVAPFYCNPHCHYMSYFEGCRDALNEIAKAYNGVTVADVTSMHKSLLEYKDYLDFSGDNMCHPNDFMARIFAQVCLETIVPGGIEAYTVGSEPPVIVPDEGNTNYATPSGYGWQWSAAEAYGFIGNYGGNGQDIEYTVDLALISSAAETAEAHFYTAEGGSIIVTPTGVSMGGRTYAYDWGVADISNWHAVTFKLLNGVASVYIDGKIVGHEMNGFSANTSHQLFFSYLGCMAIDNMSMRTSGGQVYFDCDFEDYNEAEKLMGEGLGQRTILAANTVSFDLNGGEGNIPNQIKVKNTDLIITDAVPQREGYSFLGWAYSKTATAHDLNSGDVYTTDTSVTLYAVWEEISDEESVLDIGDLNGDGKVNSMDANTLKRILSGAVKATDAQTKASDINGDGLLNSMDANILARYNAGLIENFR